MSTLVSCPLSMRDRSWSIDISATPCCAGASCAIAGNGVASNNKARAERIDFPIRHADIDRAAIRNEPILRHGGSRDKPEPYEIAEAPRERLKQPAQQLS